MELRQSDKLAGVAYDVRGPVLNEAMRLGVHEFLVKPTSPAALRDRLLSILIKPRPMIQVGKHQVGKHT